LHLLDDTWINQRGSPDTSENFQLKMMEIKKKAETPKTSKISQAKTFTIINNPERGNSQFKLFKKMPKNCEFNSVNSENIEKNPTIKNSILPGDIPGSTLTNIISNNEVIRSELPYTQNLLKKVSSEDEIPVANEFIGTNKTNPTCTSSNYIPKMRNTSNSHNNLIDLSQYSFYQQEQYDCNDEMNDSDIKNRELGSKSINPRFIEKNNTSTRFSTNESNESFDSKYNPQNCEEKFSYNFSTPTINRNYSQVSNFSNEKNNFPIKNIIFPTNNNFYINSNTVPQYLNFNNPNIYLNSNFYENEMAHSQSRQKMNLQGFPENAFSFNVDPSAGGPKSFSEKKKLKKSKEELDQTLFIINTQNIIEGKDKRTTIMIRHIPNKYSNQSLLEEINVSFKGKYDFFYLPMDFEVN
jgi:hypothetical protein